MSATLITKCPQCERETGHCLDHGLSNDRTEYDGRPCIVCRKTTNQNGLRTPTRKTRLSGPYYYNRTMTRALWTSKFQFKPTI